MCTGVNVMLKGSDFDQYQLAQKSFIYVMNVIRLLLVCRFGGGTSVLLFIQNWKMCNGLHRREQIFSIIIADFLPLI